MITIQQNEAQEEKLKEERKAKEKEKEKAKTVVKALTGAKTREKAKLAETLKAKVKAEANHLHLSGQLHLVESHRQGSQTDHHAISSLRENVLKEQLAIIIINRFASTSRQETAPKAKAANSLMSKRMAQRMWAQMRAETPSLPRK